MARFTAKNKVTGETVSFEWNNPDPPSEDDVSRISDQQREQRIAAKQSVAKNSEQTFTERLMTSPASEYAMKAANALGLNQPWHPLDSMKEIGRGIRGIIEGGGATHTPEGVPYHRPNAENPRIAGAAQAVRGAMGTVGPPLTAAGYAMAPVAMAGGMVAGNLASTGVRKGIETVAPDTSPEVTELASTAAGLVVGGVAGHRISKLNASSSAPIKPTPTDIVPPRKVYGRWETPGGENVGTIVNLGPRQLPPGRVEPPFTPQGPRAPVAELPPVPEPSSVPQFNYGDRSTLPTGQPEPTQLPPVTPPLQRPGATALPQGPEVPQLPERGQPIEMPSAPLRMPPAGTYEAQQQAEQQFTPPAPRQLEAPKDLVSETRPEPLSPSETPTVQVSSPPEQTTPAAPPAPAPPVPQAPVAQTPPIAPAPAPVAPPVPPPVATPRAYTPPAPPMGPVSSPVDPMAVARAAMAKRNPPAPPAPAQAPTPTPMPPPRPQVSSPEVRVQYEQGLKSLMSETGGKVTDAIREYLNKQSDQDWLESNMTGLKVPEEAKEGIRTKYYEYLNAKEAQAQFMKDHPNPTNQISAWPSDVQEQFDRISKERRRLQNVYKAEADKHSTDPDVFEVSTAAGTHKVVNIKAPGHVPPPPEINKSLPPVSAPKSSMDIARAAMGKSIPDVSKPGVKSEPTPPTPTAEAETPMLSPEQTKAAKINNDVISFLKKRQNVTVDQIQRQFGLPADKTRAIMGDLQKRGLIAQKAGKYNYNRMPGEQIDEPPEASPPTATDTDTSTDLKPLSSYRQKRMSSLQEQIGTAEDEGDTTSADVLRDHLRTEEAYTKIEHGTDTEAKQRLSALDFLYDQINKLEEKESTSDLTEKETGELGKMYTQANRLENLLQQFLKSEHGQQGGTQEGPKRGFFARRSFIRNLENPGEAKPNRISAFSAKLGSAHRVLRESGIPGAKEIGEGTPLVEDLKHKFVGTYERRAADTIKGLNKQLRVEVGTILDKYADPERATGFDPRSLQAAIKLRDILDEVHDMFPGGATRAGKDVGYIPNYLTHIKKTLGSDSDFAGILEDLYEYHVGPYKAIKDLFKGQEVHGEGTERPLGQFGVGKPSSPFVERRAGDLEDYELDIARVLPVYIESAAKVIYDKPWIDKAKGYLGQIPDNTNAKELATAYLRNYARYDAYPGLQKAWDTATGRIMRVAGRSILGFDTRLWALHSARLLSNIFPELPAKYMSYGAAQVIKSPLESYSEVGRQGILPQNIRPWMFKRPMEKVDSVGNALSIFDFIPDGVAYHGFKKMYTDAGYSTAEAGRMAANKTKDVSLRVTPARAAKFFSDDLGPLKPFTQFKQQVFKIAEQYATQPLDAIKRGQYDRLARYVIGVGSMMYMYKKFRISTWHLDPFHLSSFHAAAYDHFGSILSDTTNSLSACKDGDTAKGEKLLKKALLHAGLLTIPGGISVSKQIKKGPSMFEPEPKGGSTSPRLPTLH